MKTFSYRYRLVPGLLLEYVSPSVSAIIGYSAEEIAADPMLPYRIVLPEDLEKMQALRPVQGPTGPVTTRVRHKQSHILWIEHRIRPIRDSAGNLIGLEGEGRDVSDTFAAQQALQDSDTRLRMALQSSEIGLWECELNEGKLSTFGLERLLRLSPQSKPPATIEEGTKYLHPEDAQRLHEEYKLWIARRRFETEFRVLAADQTVRWFSVGGEVHTTDGGTRLMGHVQDITSKKQVELALMESEERLRLALEAAEIGIWDWDIPNNHIARTGGVTALYGRSPGSLSKFDSFQEAIFPEDRERVSQAIQSAVQHDTPYDIEFRVVWPNGEIHWIGSTGRVWRKKCGTPYRMMGYMVDITKRKASEAAMRAALEKAEEANKVKTAIFANMSHEIRTPMTAILGYSDLLAKRLAGSNLEKYAQTIYRGGTRLLHLLNSIVDLARIESGKTAFNPVRFSANESIERVVNLLRVLAEQKGLQIAVCVQDALWLETDVNAFEQVLTNIIGNAIRFTKEGTVTIDAERESPAALRIRVTDTGIGISSGFLAQVFDEFRQESEGYGRTHEGSGLGLSISKKLIERMGGQIAIQSEKGRGTTVSIVLPLDLAQSGHDIVHEARREEFPQPSRSAILIVEDDEATGDLLRYFLGEENTSWCKTGEEALRLAEERNFDLVLIDIHLKNSAFDGIETLRRLRGVLRNKQAPAIALTAYAMTGDREAFLAKGFHDYLAKPFLQADLLAVVQKHLARVG